MIKKNESFLIKAGHFSSNLVAVGLINLALLLPYSTRVRLIGWIISNLLARVAGVDKRIRNNLNLACPDMPESEIKRLCRAVPNNVGRTLIEAFSGAEFIERAKAAPIGGPGLKTFEEARAKGRPVILVAAHFGNYDVVRANLIANGHPMGGFFRSSSNPYFSKHYIRALSTIGTPLFEQGRRGMMGMVKHLRAGGILGILTDRHVQQGARLTFFGQNAYTSPITAELALKYDALLIPVYAIRQPNGLDFEITVQAPIEHTDPLTMTQAVNDGLETLVRAHMDQWFWVHRRWKPGP